MSTSVSEETEIFFIRVWETSPDQTRFKNLEGKFEREISKRTISASGGLELLHKLFRDIITSLTCFFCFEPNTFYFVPMIV